jgi:hypothetical protein
MADAPEVEPEGVEWRRPAAVNPRSVMQTACSIAP